MSDLTEQNKTNIKWQEFIDTLEEVIVCPYCGDMNQLDPPLPCCGEVHAEEAYMQFPETKAEILLYDSDLQAAFKVWTKSHKHTQCKKCAGFIKQMIALLKEAHSSMHVQLFTRGGPHHMVMSKKAMEKFFNEIGEDYAG